MWHHHLLVFYRNALRFKRTFIVNLLGLSSGLACALVIYFWIQDELHMDHFLEDEDRIYTVMENHHQTNRIMTVEASPGILAEALREEIPEIEDAVQIVPEFYSAAFTLSYGERNIKGKGEYAGKSFFDIFSLNLITGNRETALQENNIIVLSRNMATRLFGSPQAAMGKAIQLNHDKSLAVRGVFEDLPSNADSKFDFLLPYQMFIDRGVFIHWDNHNTQTLVKLKEGTDINKVNAKIENFIKGKFPESLVTLFLKPYAERYLYGTYKDGKLAGGRIEYVRLFGWIAIFILLIACINFMNLSTAKATQRIKEISVKKAIGASRKTIMQQYFLESLLLACIALLVAVLIVKIFLPTFNEITGKNLHLRFSISNMALMLGITIGTGLLAGSYPAIYLSGFQPIAILRGSMLKIGGEKWARKSLVVLQFVLSIVLVVGVLVTYRQIRFIQEKHLGFDRSNVVFLNLDGELLKDGNHFISQAREIKGVEKAALSGGGVVSEYGTTIGVEWKGKQAGESVVFGQQGISYDFIEALGMELAQGRSFSRQFPTDSQGLIINQAAANAMHLDNPIGQEIQFWGEKKHIIGVVKDFNYASLHTPIYPWIFRFKGDGMPRAVVKIAKGQEQAVMPRIQKLYEDLNPGFPFEYNFLDVQYDQMYTSEIRVAILSRYFAGLAILISCLGLFGLSAYTAERRMKEISIRKILGSSKSNIVLLLTGEFTRLVVIAIILAIPLSYWISTNWLQTFEYHVHLDLLYFLAAAVTALLISWLTVGYQAMRAADSNPVKILNAN